MKKIIQSLFMATTGLTVAITMGTKPANALTFMFSQSAWQNDNGDFTGGQVIGMFSGNDKNGDNKIIFDPNDPLLNEVSSYQMSFEGDSVIANFTHDTLDLLELEYMLGSPTMTILASDDMTSLYDGRFSLIDQDNQDIISTDEIITVKEVSEPSSLLGVVLLSLGFYLKGTISSKS